jgi:predicted secreted protein
MRLPGHIAVTAFFTLAFALASTVQAQGAEKQGAEKMREPQNIVTLDATVQTQIVPDMAVIVMAVERNAADPTAVTSEINQIIAAGLKEAKATAGVIASTGAFNTQPRWDNKGQRTGWTVRAELMLRGKDFGVLGKLAGKLSGTMQIANNFFEVSPELKQAEEEKLIEQGLGAFQSKARAASKSLGFTAFTLREVHLGSATVGGEGRPRPMMMQSAKTMSDSAAPMSLEAGPTTLSLTVNGSVQMR